MPKQWGNPYVLDCRDKDGIRTVYETGNFERHKRQGKHPELDDLTFISENAKIAINDPDVIYRSYSEKGCLCLYRKDGEENDLIIYTKVVIRVGETDIGTGEVLQYIKSAFQVRTITIREASYGKPVYLKK